MFEMLPKTCAGFCKNYPLVLSDVRILITIDVLKYQ
jgi:hypothetical protein